MALPSMLSMVNSPRLAMVATRARVAVEDTDEREKTAAGGEKSPPSAIDSASALAFDPPDVARRDRIDAPGSREAYVRVGYVHR